MRIRHQLDLILASALCVCSLPLASRATPLPQSTNASTRKLSAGSDSSSSGTSAKAGAAKSSSSRPGTSTAKKTATSRKTVAHKTVRPHAPLAPTSGRISEIQSALASQGAFQGDPTGRWDDATVSAMRKFQSANGLNASGKLDALTLEKLGLGSDTAGRGAPYPRVAPPAAAPQVSANPKPVAPSPLTPSTMAGAADHANTSTAISPAQN